MSEGYSEFSPSVQEMLRALHQILADETPAGRAAAIEMLGDVARESPEIARLIREILAEKPAQIH